ncbi:hypothetical protein GEMRC1_014035 [Eukaryota sp. GEM-RC1]
MFYGGTLSGAGLITLKGDTTFLSDVAKELHGSIINQDSLLVNTTSPINFKGSGSITSSGTVSFVSDTVLQYSPDHDHQGQGQPIFSNQGTMHVSVPTELRIDIPFINHDVININSGTFHFTNPDELMGNYVVHSKLLITTDSEFRRGVLLEGNGEIEIDENTGVTFDGSFLLDGNVILRSGATLDFLSRSNTRFFFSNLTECNSKVTWNAGSRLTLRGLYITSACGHFTIKSDARWEPHSSFNSYVYLTGTSVFTVESGTDDVTLHNVELFQQAQIIVHRTVSLNDFSFFGGYLAGTGSIVLPTSATVTTDSYKEIAVDVFNNGMLVFDNNDIIILTFRGGNTLTNSASVFILSNTSFLLADGQANNGPSFYTQGSLEVKGNSTFQIDVLFSNSEDVYVEFGSQLIINNIDELLKNYLIEGKLMVGSEGNFLRYTLIHGSGDFIVLPNSKVTITGVFTITGNLQVHEDGILNFVRHSDITVLNSNYAEQGASINWLSGSRLSLTSINLTVDNGHYRIHPGAEWRPTSSFSSLLTLSGSSIFELAAGSEEVLLDTIFLDGQAQVLVDRFVTISHFTFAGGKVGGRGSVVSPTFFNFTSGTYKELHIQIVNTGQIYFDSFTDADDIPVGFEGAASILNAGTISVKSAAHLFTQTITTLMIGVNLPFQPSQSNHRL